MRVYVALASSTHDERVFHHRGKQEYFIPQKSVKTVDQHSAALISDCNTLPEVDFSQSQDSVHLGPAAGYLSRVETRDVQRQRGWSPNCVKFNDSNSA